MQFKLCTTCNQTKDIKDFRSWKGTIYYKCKICENKQYTKAERLKREVKEAKEWACLYRMPMS